MILRSEDEMISYGEELAKSLKLPVVIELIGDVGAGKTTITKGIAKGLGVKTDITSPTFTISKKYAVKNGYLVHYDFYRLPEPGIMVEDLYENISDQNTVTIVEWGESVSGVLPEDDIKIKISLNDDGSRTVERI